MADTKTARAAPRAAPLPLAFTLHDADEESVLYSMGGGQSLVLAISNQSAGRLTIPAGGDGGEAALALGFSAGVLEDPPGVSLDAESVAVGWRLGSAPRHEGGKLYLELTCAVPKAIGAGETLRIGIGGARAAGGGPSRGTLVALRYRGLSLAGASGPLAGTATHRISVLHHFPGRLFRLDDKHAPVNLGGRLAPVANLEAAVVQLRDTLLPPLLVQGAALVTPGASTLTVRLCPNPAFLAQAGGAAAVVSIGTAGGVRVGSDDAGLRLDGEIGVSHPIADPADIRLAAIDDAELTRMRDRFVAQLNYYLSPAVTQERLGARPQTSERIRYAAGTRAQAVEKLAQRLGLPFDRNGGISPRAARLLEDLQEARSIPEFRALARTSADSGPAWRPRPSAQDRSDESFASPPVDCELSGDTWIELSIPVRAGGAPRLSALRIGCEGVRLGATELEDCTLRLPVVIGPARADGDTLVLDGPLALGGAGNTARVAGAYPTRLFAERGWNLTLADAEAALRVGPSTALNAAQMTHFVAARGGIVVGDTSDPHDNHVAIRAGDQAQTGIRLQHGGSADGFALETTGNGTTRRLVLTHRHDGRQAAALAVDETSGHIGIGPGGPSAKVQLAVDGDVSASHVAAESIAATGTVSAKDVSAESVSGFGTIPVGGIIMWSGSSKPPGWAFCDGGTYDGHRTPDLRDRFIMAAGSRSPTGSAGGQDEVRLSESNLPPFSIVLENIGTGSHAYSITSTYFLGNPTLLTSNPISPSFPQAKLNLPFDNRPRFYALAFIMRVR